jgi:hypothetical protein
MKNALFLAMLFLFGAISYGVSGLGEAQHIVVMTGVVVLMWTTKLWESMP